MYYPIRLSDLALLGPADALPIDLRGLAQSSLDDVAAAIDPCPPQHAGVGYWPVLDGDPTVFDPETHRLSGDIDTTVDPVTRTVITTQRVVALTPAEIAVRVAARLASDRADVVAAIDAERDRRLALGALHQGKRFSMSDTSRTDQGGMATTAGLVVMGLLPWPDSYAQGWIALDNTRLPLPTPQDGIALAAKVGLTYSEIVQHARTLKDAALVGDPAAVDPLAGWPD